VFLPAIYVNLTGKFHLVIHTLVFWLRSGLILFLKKYKKNIKNIKNILSALDLGLVFGFEVVLKPKVLGLIYFWALLDIG